MEYYSSSSLSIFGSIHIGIPDPPEPPAVHNINSTSINVTWSPPWQAPVNYYVLNIVTNDADDTRNITVNGNSYIVNRPDNFDCATYSFSVSASTDIGDTDFSELSFGNFSTGLFHYLCIQFILIVLLLKI